MKIFSTLIPLLFCFCQLKAQPDNATPEEKKALDKAIPLIIQTLNQFNSDDWNLEQDFYGNDVMVNQKPDVPMDINQNFERQYRVKYNSDRYKTLMQPILEKANTAVEQGDLAKAQELGKENKKFSAFTVNVYINRKIAEVNPDERATLKINVKGVDLCFHTNKDQYDNETNTYVLLFGNWKSAKNGQYGLHYPFIHLHKTPYIENIEIILKGADDYLQHLLKTVDWLQIQNALTP